jgi:hypothetical protein
MFQALLAFTAGFLYVGNLLRGLTRGILDFRNLHDIASHLMPSLPSPHTTHLLDAPIAPLELLEELSTPSSSGGLIVIEVSPPALPSHIPTGTLSYQSSLVTIAPNCFLDLVHLLPLLVFISGLVHLLPGLVYTFSTIPNRTSTLFRLSRKGSNAFSFKSIFSLVLVLSLVPLFSFMLLCHLAPLFSLVLNFFSTRIFSLRLLVSYVSLSVLWTGLVSTLLSPGHPAALTKYPACFCLIIHVSFYIQVTSLPEILKYGERRRYSWTSISYSSV